MSSRPTLMASRTRHAAAKPRELHGLARTDGAAFTEVLWGAHPNASVPTRTIGVNACRLHPTMCTHHQVVVRYTQVAAGSATENRVGRVKPTSTARATMLVVSVPATSLFAVFTPLLTINAAQTRRSLVQFNSFRASRIRS